MPVAFRIYNSYRYVYLIVYLYSWEPLPRIAALFAPEKTDAKGCSVATVLRSNYNPEAGIFLCGKLLITGERPFWCVSGGFLTLMYELLAGVV